MTLHMQLVLLLVLTRLKGVFAATLRDFRLLHVTLGKLEKFSPLLHTVHIVRSLSCELRDALSSFLVST